MRKAARSSVFLLVLGLTASCGAAAREEGESVADLLEEILAVERSALDRWITGDPYGYLEIYAPEATYFDPYQERRTDGLDALTALLSPIADMELPFTDARYEMIAPRVQHHVDVALLTFNLINYGKPADQPETVLARWNATEVYRRIDGRWKLIHSHWSFTRPAVGQPGP